MEIPSLMPTLLLPIPNPLSMRPLMDSRTISMPTAIYEFTHQATVNLQGQVLAVIYVSKGMQRRPISPVAMVGRLCSTCGAERSLGPRQKHSGR